MAQTINDNLQNNSPKSLDNKYTKFSLGAAIPYTSTTDVNTTINSAYRSIGLFAVVDEGSSNGLYWYKEGIADIDLVKFVPVSAQNGNSLNVDKIELGQTVGAVGDPAILLASREVPMGGFNMTFKSGHFIVDGAFTATSNQQKTIEVVNSGTNFVRHEYSSSPDLYLEIENGTNNTSVYTYEEGHEVTVNTATREVSHIMTAATNTLVAKLDAANETHLVLTTAQFELKASQDVSNKEVTFESSTDILNSITFPFYAGFYGLRSETRHTTNNAKPVSHIAKDSGETYFDLGEELDEGAGNYARSATMLKIGKFVPASASPALSNAPDGCMYYDDTNKVFKAKENTVWNNILTGNSGATAPATVAAGSVTNRYGGATNFLGDPVSWISIRLNGTTFKIPLYS